MRACSPRRRHVTGDGKTLTIRALLRFKEDPAGNCLAVNGNVAVMLAALGVFGTGSAWPDLAVATLMSLLAISGAATVLRHARGELRLAGS